MVTVLPGPSSNSGLRILKPRSLVLSGMCQQLASTARHWRLAAKQSPRVTRSRAIPGRFIIAVSVTTVTLLRPGGERNRMKMRRDGPRRAGHPGEPRQGEAPAGQPRVAKVAGRNDGLGGGDAGGWVKGHF